MDKGLAYTASIEQTNGLKRGGIVMRDWYRNGRIDARDRYLFHEVILKDNTPEKETEFVGRASRNRSTTQKAKSKNIKEMSGLEIFGWAVFSILALIGFIVS